MIKCETNKGKISITAGGTAVELTSDCLTIIRHIYEAVADRINVDVAEMLRSSLVEVLTDPDSPFFLPIDGDNAEDDGNES